MCVHNLVPVLSLLANVYPAPKPFQNARRNVHWCKTVRGLHILYFKKLYIYTKALSFVCSVGVFSLCFEGCFFFPFVSSLNGLCLYEAKGLEARFFPFNLCTVRLSFFFFFSMILSHLQHHSGKAIAKSLGQPT